LSAYSYSRPKRRVGLSQSNGGGGVLFMARSDINEENPHTFAEWKKIRDFRNRIYHNELICFNGNSVDFAYANRIKSELYELLDWIDSDLSAYVKTFDTIDSKINSANRI
jgi:hypothetical protein